MKYGTLLMVVIVAITGCHGGNLMQQNLPPSERLMHPGPGVDGPGPGVLSYDMMPAHPGRSSQVAFVGPDGTSVAWDVGMPGMFDSAPMICPGRANFPQGAIYRMKLTSIPGRPGVELYPTMEVGPAMPRTEAFLAHNAIPVQFTEEDFDQVLSGNFVTKVIYLPDPEYQELALAGVETLVSTRLDPGVDPIVEADRRGAILAVVRLGNKDLEVPGEETIQPGQVVPVSYVQAPDGSIVPVPAPEHMGMPMGVPMGTPGGTVPVNYISGVTGPQYGMPMCGTPIGLPGPPHVPLGSPAGLQKHTMKNYTRVKVPAPTEHMKIHVRQDPGFSYPKPASKVFIVEQTHPGPGKFKEPAGNHQEVIIMGDPGGVQYEEPYNP